MYFVTIIDWRGIMNGIGLRKRCLLPFPSARFILLCSVIAISTAFLPCTSQSAVMSSGSYRMVADVVSGGGGDAASDNYAVRQTLGQSSAIGPSESSSFRNYAGFWYSAIFSNMDRPSSIGPMLLLLLDE